MHFWKVHGLGNDFALVDATRGGKWVTPAQAAALCHRHTGIGADGVLTVLPSLCAAFRMHLYNADGSEPEMCGNGIRCFVKYLVDHALTRELAVAVETGRGVLPCRATLDARGAVETVSVDMGAPLFERSRIPMKGDGEYVGQTLQAGGLTFVASAVSMGNPHLVVLLRPDLEVVQRLGPELEAHPWFPNRVNVNFAAVRGPREIDLVVYERGSGITQACGTGACATAAVCARLGLVERDQEISVHLPGGTLHISVPGDGAGIWMRGPALEVYEGDLFLPGEGRR